MQNDGVDVGTLIVDRVTPSFSLSLDVPTPEEPELTFINGQPAHFRLKNADSEEYRIGWEYSIDGRVVRSEDSDSTTEPERTAWYRRWLDGEAFKANWSSFARASRALPSSSCCHRKMTRSNPSPTMIASFNSCALML